MHGTERPDRNVAQILRALQRSSESDQHPGRRLRIAVLLRAFADVREGGRNGWDALRWLLDDRPNAEGLSARELMEEFHLDVAGLRRTLRASYGLGGARVTEAPAGSATEAAGTFAKSA